FRSAPAGAGSGVIAGRLAATDGIAVQPAPAGPAAATADLAAGALDAVLEVTPAVDGDWRLRLEYDGSRERSDAARGRVEAALRTLRAERVRADAAARGVTPADWAVFALDERNTASSREMGAFVLGLMLPIFFVVMVAVGCFYPAVDTTAGERERHTWETLMTTAASRANVMTAKFLYVATFGGIAGLLNVAAMTLTLRGVLAPIAGGEALEFAVPLAALPVLAVAAILLASFIAAGMMVLAAFARTFREGQTLITPFYLAVLLPTVFLSSRGTDFTPALSAVPVVNIALVTRDAFAGVFRAPQMAIAVVVTLAGVAALVRLATMIVQAEDVMTGAFSGTLPTFLRARVLGPRKGPGR
ncbi:MAG: ABC transporter permease, partial [Vicinamibacterales bacterium]